MTSSKKLLMGLFFFLFSAASQAQNFYVCDANGNDEFDGRSEAKPFKTYDKAIWSFNKLDAGGSLLFCRGGKFEANISTRLVNSKCSAIERCTIGDYGNDALDKPVISANGVNAINFENGGGSKEDGGYIVKNLTLIAATKSGAGVQLYNDVDDVLITDVHIEGFNIGVYSASTNNTAEGAVSNQINDRLVVKNSTIINNKKIGFLGGCNDCLIENNHFENNGNHPSLDHNIYLAQKKFPAKGITIRNNTLYKSAIVDGKCQGVSLVGHGLLEDVLIEHNIIKEDAGKVNGLCWGISIDPGYPTMDESFKNIIIRNNKIINIGGNAIGCASCDGAIIEGNEIIDDAKMMTAGIRVPVREENSTKSKNVVIRNNKVIASHENAVGVWIGGINASIVANNEITLPDYSRVECIFKTLANITTNTNTNICKTHNGLSIVDPTDEGVPNLNDEQVAETPEEQVPNDEEQEEVVDNSPVDEGTNNQEQEVVDNAPIIEEPVNQEPEIVDNSPVQEENPGQEVVDSTPRNESTDVITDPIDNVQTPSTDVAGNDATTTQSSTSLPNTATNGSKIGVNEQQAYDDTSTSMLNKKPRNAAGGGSSGGGSSSKSRTESTSNNELAGADDVISYTTPVTSSSTPTSVMSVETEQMDITKGLPKANPESSKYSVKVKDVIQALREEKQVADVTQCRAYAAGRCLMK